MNIKKAKEIENTLFHKAIDKCLSSYLFDAHFDATEWLSIKDIKKYYEAKDILNKSNSKSS